MHSWMQEALMRLDRSAPCVLVSIAGVAGSAPREAGAKMIVGAEDVWGTIGGGALEHVCIEQARGFMTRSDERTRAQDYPLGPLLGQCCGGKVRIALERLGADDRDWLENARTFDKDGVDYHLVLPLQDGARAAQSGWLEGQAEAGVVLRGEDGAALSVQHKEKWASRIEAVRPRARRVCLLGGGHVGAALANILKTLPVHLDWVDSRENADSAGAKEAGYGGARLSDDPLQEVRFAAPNTAFVILTHSHVLDFDLTAAALRRNDALYVGVIGSKTKRQRFLNRLEAAGLSEAQRAKMICPIGALGLSSKEPSVIALAVAAELMLKFETAESVPSSASHE